MLTSFSMAFYYTSIRTPQIINNAYYKFNINAYKLHLSRRQVATKSKQLWHKRGRNELSKEPIKLGNYIEFRKSEAKRSIIIQVASWKSCKDVINYCSQFGHINNIYQYSLPKDYQFVLIEYQNLASAIKAMTDATYIDKENIVPTRTNVMWFRKRDEIISEAKGTIPPINSIKQMSLNEANIKHLLATATTVSSQIITLYNEYKITELETRLKFQIISSLEQYFSGIFPSVIVHPFGSFVNGFGKRSSDLDIVLFADGLKEENSRSKLVFHAKSVNVNGKKQINEFMGVLADTMKYMIPGISNVRKIFNARVPIIKFNNIFMHSECDLSTSNVIATYMTELLYLYGEIDVRVRPLVFTIRKWAYDNKLTHNHPGRTITNFSLTLLVIFFLQKHRIIPCINQMEGFSEVNQFDNVMDQIYLHSVRKNWIIQDNKDQLGTLLVNFFKYYSTFNFSEFEICLRTGCTIKKSNHQPLYIHNPFEPGLNVSKNVSQSEIDRLKTLMIIALSNLQNTKYSQSKNWGILSIFNNTNFPSINLNVTEILSNEESTSDDQEISENNDTIETIQESDVNNAVNVKTDINRV